MAFIASMIIASLGSSGASASTFANGSESFHYDISPQSFAVREGAMKTGEKAFFAISGGMVDVYVFNGQQYYSYVNQGKYQSGWEGAAVFRDLGTSNSSFSFTAPADGDYVLVIDNTVAGTDPGNVQKSISMNVIYPFENVDNQAPWPFLAVVLVGIAGLALLVLVVFSRK